MATQIAPTPEPAQVIPGKPPMPPPPADWQDSLDRIEEAVRAASRALERAEDRWEIALAPSAGEGEIPVPLARIDARLTEWESRLRAAEELTLAVERELAERATTLDEWRTRFAKWVELIERRGNTSPAQ